ncbi:hypothetical protein [Vibrio harveyi]|uniref:hypothetical protein n=1 Tax=Vibrio harveyi TaxID=669 RepID=UPI0025B09D1B|nr:hypothetical protein [Vibrio harveyi]WJT09258.1 hypothetical protein PH545_24845 [Vibrio harveyi]
MKEFTELTAEELADGIAIKEKKSLDVRGMTIAVYLAQFGVCFNDIIDTSGRSRSTINDWWRRRDFKMLDMAIRSVLFDKAVTTKAKRGAIKRHVTNFNNSKMK